MFVREGGLCAGEGWFSWAPGTVYVCVMSDEVRERGVRYTCARGVELVTWVKEDVRMGEGIRACQG